MRPCTHLLFLLAASGALASPGAATKAPTTSDRLKQRIEILLQHRMRPDALPVILPNPFEVVSGGAVAGRPDGPDPGATDNAEVAKALTGKLADELPPGSSSEALARCVAKLRIGGTVTLKGQLQIIINDYPRKEGDTVVLDRNNAMTYLQVVKVAPGALTLRLNEATQTIRF